MAIQFNVSGLLKEPIGASREYEVDSRVAIDSEPLRECHVTGRTAFLRTNDGVLVRARLEGFQRESCSRCLTGLDIHLGLDIEEEFIMSSDSATGARGSGPPVPDAQGIDERHTLDLSEIVRQHWTTVFPMQPLCRADCRGLCSRCGQDLNERDCFCPQEEDTRWAALQQLMTKNEGS